MNMLKQLQVLKEAIQKMSDEELRQWVGSVPPEVASAYATLENWIREERYFVISEIELYTLLNPGTCDTGSVTDAENKCRSRPVPKWATHFAVVIEKPEPKMSQFQKIGIE